VNGQPVLIDFDRSVFLRSAYDDAGGSVKPRDDSGSSLATRLWHLVFGTNLVAPAKSRTMLGLVKRNTAHPMILVIGGGAIGSGANALYRDQGVQTLGTDVYASINTQVLADGHHLPFKSGAFDGVWIQAVLEHVLEPQTVVDEIYRTLKHGGYVYADTPFMQQVHEGAYDFTRFTLSGHRWLFRRFEQIDAGTVAGPGVALIFSIRYFVRALGFPDKIATLAALPFFWLRLLGTASRGAGQAPTGQAALSFSAGSPKKYSFRKTWSTTTTPSSE